MKIYSLMTLGFAAALLASSPALSSDDSRAQPAKPAPDIMDIYAPAMEKMHQEMMIAPTGDADVDFVMGMIPHHQGAIDMAKILLEKGDDPEIRALCEGIIAAQEKEIAFMNEWLKKNKPQ